MSKVTKKTKKDKDELFTRIRQCVEEYQYCIVFGVENQRNTHLQEVRQELKDSRYDI